MLPGNTSSSAAKVPDDLEAAQHDARRYAPPPVDRAKVVQRPVSNLQVEDPREFQLQQLRRRFSPKEVSEETGTALSFSMPPSDPDFPFEMDGLECVLHVPTTYPKIGKPSLDVKNKEMGRGYQINVERGFDALVAKSPQSTLLGLINALDKQLESLLTEQKAETVKIMPNAGGSVSQRQAGTQQSTTDSVKATQVEPAKVSKPEQIYTAEQKSIAQARRETETRQLEARLGRLPLFFKSSDGIAYTLPIEPRKGAELPVPLQAVKTVRLFVPLLYPLQPCRIEIQGVSREAAAGTEKGFEKRARESADMTLMAHVNYLSQNMHFLATEPVEDTQAVTDNEQALASLQLDNSAPAEQPRSTSNLQHVEPLDDRSHIVLIPRPPEWTILNNKGDSASDSDSDIYDSDYSTSSAASDNLPPVPESSATAEPERGILLSFPFLELHGIELLELTSLSLTIKCDRCKDHLDVKNLKNNPNGEQALVRNESCKKCASQLSISTFLLP